MVDFGGNDVEFVFVTQAELPISSASSMLSQQDGAGAVVGNDLP